MPVHLYFMPITRIVTTRIGRGPKYLRWQFNSTGLDVPWQMLDYGHIDLCIVAADTTLPHHQALFDAPDVLSIDPRNGNIRNLGQNATAGEINALVNYLDNAGNFVPMGWATTSDTRRQILRGICGIFLFVQRVTVLAGGVPPPQWGINLTTEWSELSLEQQGWLSRAARDMNLSRDTPPADWTMRQILRFLGNRWNNPIDLGLTVL